MRVCLLLFVTVAFVSSAPFASAHSPYLSASKACDSMDGYEMRILNGDGIFGPDPRAFVVTDPDGRLVAHQSVGKRAFLAWYGDCVGYDPDVGLAYAPDVRAFEPGPIVVGDSQEARTGRIGVEPGVTDYGDFGLRVLSLSFGERFGLAVRSNFGMFTVLALGFAGFSLFWTLRRRKRSRKTSD